MNVDVDFDIVGRRPLDAYETPDPLATAICGRLVELLPEPRRIVEPSAGRGAFVQAARKQWPLSTIAAVDIRGECCDSLARVADETIIGDWAKLTAGKCPAWLRSADLILGNPPFTFAEEHIRAAWPHLLPGASIAFLLRVGFVCGVHRWEEFFPHYPLRFYIPIVPRPDFTGSGGDMSEYALFVFTADWLDDAKLLPAIRWQKGRK